MAAPSLDGDHPSGRASRRQQAPSLDVTAAQSSSQTALTTEESESGTVQESRSSSSTNSPAPNDNEESDFFLVPNDSESSLGVSNLQDMHVVDDGDENVCISPVNRLPNEILISIFAKLGSSADLLHCMLTCKRWARNSVDLLWHRPACTNWGRHKSICQTLGLPNQYFHYKDFIKRLNLASIADKLTDDAVRAFAAHCLNILEIDLHQCRLITNDPVTELLAQGQTLRELRLANCELISDSAFLNLPPERVYEHLRILDLTSCIRLTDQAVDRIITVAPRLRNLVLAKCRNISDSAVNSIARLGKNLHYVHLGHCSQITDVAVKKLVQCCNRIRYIDLGCCVHLTDDSVTRLATLPKLKRIGLVKCSNITDESVNALARANQRHRQRRDMDGNVIDNQYYSHSSLERVHLSYCTSLTIRVR
ncbi:hypothetical protein SPBR_02687 [Sporothrix brasiliensis 5110]|uniref:Uncharacterized protein n=1 Tax=Sporothrix brasiliensis 5110 TaxID=1398154 RepID=A0A0C2ISJ2_9PEZI|nr:uncharacterized protein SPBR_02687 [Sporothrix brasiliensis 5110]KIH92021.1 hypothetical protein SPBR_02687 [Sporothrix brasiliensis 5110]